jgi:peroxiredoxin family protein
MTSNNTQKLAIILQQTSYEKLHLAATLTATAATMGGEVHIFLSQEALLNFVENKFDEAKPHFQSDALNKQYIELLEDGKTPKVTDLFKRAQKFGLVKFYGCSETVQLFHLGTDYTKKLDAVIGYTTFLDIASDAKLLVI